MISYEYTKFDRLEKPHNYMYTPYFGCEFIQSYFNDRARSIERFKSLKDEQDIGEMDTYFCTALKLKQGNKILNAYFEEKIESITFFNIENEIITEKLLVSLLINQLVDSKEILTKEWLDYLVQRFEVTKKIYKIYLPGFRKGNGETDIIRLYWLFSLSLTLYYAKTKNIKYLSTLLKINDLLCSLGSYFIRKVPIQGLELVLLIEVDSIKSLARSIKGVDLVFD